ncbi:hypothetical protein BDQ17DRAFT_1365594 [Cyathus striatus]|nr:hypothetical protein BDQ17DRAFT_1365594 [Cyathus striatus]
MNVLKGPSFFRPASRPASPAPTSRPDSAQAPDRPSRPLNKLLNSNFRRPSPSPFPTSIPTPLVQDGSYLEMLSLKLSEAVSRALAQPTGPAAACEQVAGRRPIPPGRGHALGTLIASELKTANDNLHLRRAIIRSCIVLSPLTPQSPNLNAVQLHALAIANFSEELLEAFDNLGLGIDVDARGDGLKSIREGLISLVNRVTIRLIGSVRDALTPIIEALEAPNSNAGTKAATGSKIIPVYHQSIVTLQTLVPVYSRAIARYTTSPLSHATLATFLISTVWKGMVALTHRPAVQSSPPPSPQVLSSPVLKKRQGSTSTTPPMTPPAGRFTIKLPPSRPPSPPPVVQPTTVSADARALYELLDALPRPSGDKQTSLLAKEAIDEAFEGFNAFVTFLDDIQQSSAIGRSTTDVASELEALTKGLPSLIALPVILRVYGRPSLPSVPEMLGINESEYRKGCLSGFGRAEECGTAVLHQIANNLRNSAEINIVVLLWIEMEIAEMGGMRY